MRILLWLGLAVSLFGSGCLKSDKGSVSLIPQIRLERPANGSVTTETTIEVAGSANVPQVMIGSNTFNLNAGRFSAFINLEPGLNSILLVAGNGYTTSTQVLKITREKITSNLP